MGLFSKKKTKIKIQTAKTDSYSGWIKCAGCSELIHAQELEDNKNCCPKCRHHYRLPALQRIDLLTESGSFEEMPALKEACDPLSFVDTEKYTDRLEAALKNTGRSEAVIIGTAFVHSIKVALGVLDFSFMAGSMSSVVGEQLTRLIERATEDGLPLVIVSASGGARMQESVLSLMQMAKTSAALAKLSEKQIPYISILTNPTTGGVTASFASLGDVIIAEPGALIAFAGPRVVEQTIGQKLPEGAQKSEFLIEKGMIDCIVDRHQLKEKLFSFLNFLCGNERIYDSAIDNDGLSENVVHNLPKKLQQLLSLKEQKLTHTP